MASLVCILHSADGKYSSELVADAASCVSAITRSTAALSPDMIPSVAILRADPLVGARYLYSSAVPDTNHAVEAGEMHHAPFSPFLAQVNSGSSRAGGAGGEVFNIVSAFRGRSAAFLNECIVYGTQGQVGGRSGDSDEPKPKRRKSVPGESAAAAAAAADGEDTDAWSPLAAALLSALAFLHRHTAEAPDIATSPAPDHSNGHYGEEAGAAAGEAATQRGRSLIVIFSDCAGSEAPLTYSTDCAFAVATLGASRKNASVFCFGEGVGDSEGAGRGAARLRAMAASVGGACATRFHPCLLGAMLDGRLRENGRESAGAETAHSFVTMTARAKRERIADHYVLQPTVLSRRPDSSGVERVASSAERQCVKGRHNVGSTPHTECEERESNLTWLCPQCMAVVYRSGLEGAVASDSGNTAGEESAAKGVAIVYCPYCA